MTPRQKDIVIKLLQGYSIANARRNGYRLRDPQARVVLKINAATFTRLRDLLRKSKGVYVINKNKVRQLHGNSFVKQVYNQAAKEVLTKKLEGCTDNEVSLEPALSLVRTCRVCGCTENDACYHPKGGSCWWVEADLCSHCKHWPGEGVRYSKLINGMTCSL